MGSLLRRTTADPSYGPPVADIVTDVEYNVRLYNEDALAARHGVQTFDTDTARSSSVVDEGTAASPSGTPSLVAYSHEHVGREPPTLDLAAGPPGVTEMVEDIGRHQVTHVAVVVVAAPTEAQPLPFDLTTLGRALQSSGSFRVVTLPATDPLKLSHFLQLLRARRVELEVLAVCLSCSARCRSLHNRPELELSLDAEWSSIPLHFSTTLAHCLELPVQRCIFLMDLAGSLLPSLPTDATFPHRPKGGLAVASTGIEPLTVLSTHLKGLSSVTIVTFLRQEQANCSPLEARHGVAMVHVLHGGGDLGITDVSGCVTLPMVVDLITNSKFVDGLLLLSSTNHVVVGGFPECQCTLEATVPVAPPSYATRARTVVFHSGPSCLGHTHRNPASLGSEAVVSVLSSQALDIDLGMEKVHKYPQMHGSNFRLDDVERLEAHRIREGGPMVLTGISGVGKTLLAMEYVRRYSNRYHLIWWCNASSRSLLATQLGTLAIALKVYLGNHSLTRTITVVMQHLRRHHKWLLIYDNAFDATTIQSFIPPDTGEVLITTRDSSWIDDYPVYILPREASMLLLRDAGNPTGGLKCKEDSVVDTWCGLVADLPVALNVVRAYCVHSGCSLTDLLGRYDPEGELSRLVKGGRTLSAVPNFHQQVVRAVLRCVLPHLRTHHHVASLVAECCACLPDGGETPIDIVTQYIHAQHGAPPSTILRGFGHLQQYHICVADADRGTFFMPHLIQQAVRCLSDTNCPCGDGNGWISAISSALDGELAAATPKWDCVALMMYHAMTLGKETSSVGISEETGDEAEGEGGVLSSETTTAPLRVTANSVDAYARLLWKMSSLYKRHAPLYAQSLAALTVALEAGRRLLGDTHIIVAFTYNKVGLVLEDAASTHRARQMYERSLACYRQCQTRETHPMTLTVVWCNLASARAGLGDHLGAIQAYEEAVTLTKEGDTEQAGSRVEPLIRLGALYVTVGQLEKGMQTLLEARQLCEAYPGHLGDVLVQLGDAHRKKGELGTARELYKEALVAYRSAKGQECDSSVPLTLLGQLAHEEGEHPAAAKYFERAVKLTPAGTEWGALLQYNLGHAYLGCGRTEEAAERFHDAHGRCVAQFGPGHPNTQKVRAALGLCGPEWVLTPSEITVHKPA